MGWLDAAVQAVADFLIAQACHACGAVVADDPRAAFSHPAVAQLARPVVLSVPGLTLRTRLLCDACVRGVEPWTSPRVVASAGALTALPAYPAFLADASVLALIHLLKFGRASRVAPWLAAAMALGLPARAAALRPTLVPVPMDAGSQRRRGFNQADVIARALGRRWNLPVVSDAIRKCAVTVPQSRLDRAARLRNLDRAFAPGPGAVRIRGRRVMLVDDLVTTGSTAAACATVLAGAGAGPVIVTAAGFRP